VIYTYGLQFTCDVDGNVSPLLAPEPNSGPPSYQDPPMPEGWVNLGLMRMALQDALGANIVHLCDQCGALPIVALVARIRDVRAEQAERARLEQEAVK
jgi:hypothetical protein